MTTAALVPRVARGVAAANGTALTIAEFAEAEAQIARWGREGDMAALTEARARSDAAQVYARRNEYTSAAIQYAQLKLHCEARIGRLDRELTPKLPRRPPPLELGDIRIDPWMRKYWRALGIVEERGMLNDFLESLGDVTWRDVRTEISKRGLVWVACAPLREAVKASPMQPHEIAKAASMASSNFHDALRQGRVGWPIGVRIAIAVGLDPLTLPPEPSPRQPGRQAEWARKRRETEAALARDRERTKIRRALRTASKPLADAYAMAERMQDVLGQAHREATDRQAREHLARAGQHYRAMRDEIVHALGITT